jgi:hypothetical protein
MIIANKAVLVTGANRGIGRALGQQYTCSTACPCHFFKIILATAICDATFSHTLPTHSPTILFRALISGISITAWGSGAM